jgi:hypothetical protein
MLVSRLAEKLECGKHLHDRIISLKGEVCANKTSLTPPLCIEVSVPSQECERSVMYLYVRTEIKQKYQIN